jgi:hypothetical protein
MLPGAMLGIRKSFAVVDGTRRAAVPATRRRRDRAWIVVVVSVEGGGWGVLDWGMRGFLERGSFWVDMTLVFFLFGGEFG